MKAVYCALLLLLAVSYGESLKCNRCVSGSPGSRCTTTVETCSAGFDKCGSVIFKPPLPISYFKRCMKTSECTILGINPSIDVRCCPFDRCNI